MTVLEGLASTNAANTTTPTFHLQRHVNPAASHSQLPQQRPSGIHNLHHHHHHNQATFDQQRHALVHDHSHSLSEHQQQLHQLQQHQPQLQPRLGSCGNVSHPAQTLTFSDIANNTIQLDSFLEFAASASASVSVSTAVVAPASGIAVDTTDSASSSCLTTTVSAASPNTSESVSVSVSPLPPPPQLTDLSDMSVGDVPAMQLSTDVIASSAFCFDRTAVNVDVEHGKDHHHHRMELADDAYLPVPNMSDMPSFSAVTSLAEYTTPVNGEDSKMAEDVAKVMGSGGSLVVTAAATSSSHVLSQTHVSEQAEALSRGGGNVQNHHRQQQRQQNHQQQQPQSAIAADTFYPHFLYPLPHHAQQQVILEPTHQTLQLRQRHSQPRQHQMFQSQQNQPPSHARHQTQQPPHLHSTNIAGRRAVPNDIAALRMYPHAHQRSASFSSSTSSTSSSSSSSSLPLPGHHSRTLSQSMSQASASTARIFVPHVTSSSPFAFARSTQNPFINGAMPATPLMMPNPAASSMSRITPLASQPSQPPQPTVTYSRMRRHDTMPLPTQMGASTAGTPTPPASSSSSANIGNEDTGSNTPSRRRRHGTAPTLGARGPDHSQCPLLWPWPARLHHSEAECFEFHVQEVFQTTLDRRGQTVESLSAQQLHNLRLTSNVLAEMKLYERRVYDMVMAKTTRGKMFDMEFGDVRSRRSKALAIIESEEEDLRIQRRMDGLLRDRGGTQSLTPDEYTEMHHQIASQVRAHQQKAAIPSLGRATMIRRSSISDSDSP